MYDSSSVLAKCEFFGGPLDGGCSQVRVMIKPGQLPLFGHIIRGHQYVYQATQFSSEESPTQGTLRMEMVQIVGANERIDD